MRRGKRFLLLAFLVHSVAVLAFPGVFSGTVELDFSPWLQGSVATSAPATLGVEFSAPSGTAATLTWFLWPHAKKLEVSAFQLAEHTRFVELPRNLLKKNSTHVAARLEMALPHDLLSLHEPEASLREPQEVRLVLPAGTDRVLWDNRWMEPGQVVECEPGVHWISLPRENGYSFFPAEVSSFTPSTFVLFPPENAMLFFQSPLLEKGTQLRTELDALVFLPAGNTVVGTYQTVMRGTGMLETPVQMHWDGFFYPTSVNIYRLETWSNTSRWQQAFRLEEGLASLFQSPEQRLMEPGEWQKISLCESDWMAQLQELPEPFSTTGVFSTEATKHAEPMAPPRWRDSLAQPLELLVSSEPMGAEVSLEGTTLGKTPLTVVLPLPDPFSLVVRAPGFMDATVEVLPLSEDFAEKIHVVLEPLPERSETF